VHGARVAVAGVRDGGRVFDETDALVTDVPGLLLLLRLADCAPVYLYAPDRGVVGLAHAGWRGTVERIAARTAEKMVTTYGCRPDEIVAGVGPAIGACCFEVGPEVVAAFEAESGDAPGLIVHRQANGKAHVDLGVALALQLAAVGVTQVEQSGICTMCHRDEFFSHRGEGGRTGRFAAVMGRRAD
jgi:YfiH family protein